MSDDNQPYQENPDFVPNPADYSGTLDTSGTAGGAHGRIETVTPVFDIAKAHDLKVAARALDPEDDEVDSSLVALPSGPDVTAADLDEARQRVRDAAAEAEAKDPGYGKPNEFEAEAAEKTKKGEAAPTGVGGGDTSHQSEEFGAPIVAGTFDTSGAGSDSHEGTDVSGAERPDFTAPDAVGTESTEIKATGGSVEINGDEDDANSVEGATSTEPVDTSVTSTVDTTGTSGLSEGEQVKDQTEAVEQGANTYDPAEHNVVDVLAYIAEHPAEKDAILAAEAADGGKNRTGVLNA